MRAKLFRWVWPRMPYFNAGLTGVAYVANEYFIQGYCQPVAWAAWVLLVGTAAFLAWPWLHGRWQPLDYTLLFLQGVGFTVCLYCGCFDNPLNGLLFFFLIVPLLSCVPVLFATQMVLRAWDTPLKWGKATFVAGALALLPAQLWAELQFREVETAVAGLTPRQRQQIPVLAQTLPRTYITERLAGAYFKYHNYPEFIYDGWRPPLHDPLVNVSLWLRGSDRAKANPLTMLSHHTGADFYDLNKQASLYHQLFPNLPVKVNCVCSQMRDGEPYREWVPALEAIR